MEAMLSSHAKHGQEARESTSGMISLYLETCLLKESLNTETT